MRMSYPILKLFGISIELHITFILLILGSLVLFLVVDPAGAFFSMAVLLLLFLAVLLHELCHSLVSLSMKIKVGRIVLLPIGGMAVADEMPSNPVQEFLIAIAGPLFNFFVVFAIALLVSAFPQIPWPWELFNPDTITIEGFEAALATNLLFAFFWINFMLGAFNLFFPALPMDGGRVLRSLLAMKFGNSRATHIATAISRFLSIALFIFGLFTFNVLIMLIAGLLYFSAGAENQMADTKDVLMGVSVAQIAKPITGTLPKEMTVSQAYLALSELNKTRALVNLSGSLGYVDIEMFSKIQKIKWQVVLLSDIAVPLKAMPIEFDALQFFMFSMSSGQPFIPVIKDGAVSSYVDIDDLMSLYSLRKALPR